MKVKICLGEHHGKKRPLFTGYGNRQLLTMEDFAHLKSFRKIPFRRLWALLPRVNGVRVFRR